MATVKISALPAANAIDATQDYFPIVTDSLATTQKINRNTFLGITGSPVGTTDIQTLTNKTIGNTNIITARDDRFTLQDSGDTTKQAVFELSGLTAATTRTYTLPDRSSTLATLGGTQVFTGANSFTGSSWSGGTISNPTLTVDSIAGFSTATIVTVAGMQVNNGFIQGSSIAAGTVGSAQLAAGVVVQTVNTISSAAATGTTTVPVDDTIPQNTEGTEFMTVAITPKSASNILVVDVIAFVAASNINNVVGALFQDSTANALAANGLRITASDSFGTVVIRHTMTAGTTSATTFKFRAGPQSAGTLTFNGAAGGRYFGAITKSSMVVWEYKV